ncbi:MAG: hypothetical protein AAF409_07885 [Pseudomonadota bacterium]
MSEVYTLLVQVGRSDDDGLPDGTTGAALLCYAAGKTEKIAVDETVQVLKQAGMAPLEVESYGARTDREADGQEIAPDEATLMDRALAENAVIVAQVSTFDD